MSDEIFIIFNENMTEKYPQEGFYGVIYCLNSPENKKYVGQTTNWNIPHRKKDGINYINNKKRYNSYKFLHCNRQPYIYNAIKKYGIQNFKIEIICQCKSWQELNDMEVKYGNLWNCLDRNFGYNLFPFGDRNGKPLSEESRLKMKIAQTGRIVSEKTILKLKLSHMGKNTNPKIYTFKHNITGEEFVGTQYEFKNKFNFSSNQIAALMSGITKTFKSWMLIQNFKPYEEIQKEFKEKMRNIRLNIKIKKHSKEANQQKSERKKCKDIFKFKNILTNEEFIGIPYDFRIKYDIKSGSLHPLISGKVKKLKNWVII